MLSVSCFINNSLASLASAGVFENAEDTIELRTPVKHSIHKCLEACVNVCLNGEHYDFINNLNTIELLWKEQERAIEMNESVKSRYELFKLEVIQLWRLSDNVCRLFASLTNSWIRMRSIFAYELILSQRLCKKYIILSLVVWKLQNICIFNTCNE